MHEIFALVQKIQPIEQHWFDQAMARQNCLTKPPQSLGRLEDIACRIAAIQQTLSPAVSHKSLVIFAADHGVTEEGVSPYPAEVTAQMVANFLRGGAAINALAKTAGARLVIVDAGVKSPIPIVEGANGQLRFIQQPVRQGSRNLAKEAALTADETLAALQLGYGLALEVKEEGVNLIGIGEMGIGNTTAAAAVTAALTGLPAGAVTGRGTGADDGILATKKAVVEQALRLHSPTTNDPLRILQTMGGLEIAGLVGVCLGAAASRIAIVCDGFIATASAALTARLCPASAGYMFAAHLSAEPGHAALLEIIQQRPLLDLNMRLGEGTGAALAMTIIDAAVRAFTEMATFESAGVSNRQG
jgi:nicotinate-nucleotide--dimethylbenzimidazole phosphoribosyltransferase